MNWLKRLLCRHEALAFVRNLYGDQIIEWGWKRSLWRCKRCKSLVPLDQLNVSPDAKESA